MSNENVQRVRRLEITGQRSEKFQKEEEQLIKGSLGHRKKTKREARRIESLEEKIDPQR